MKNIIISALVGISFLTSGFMVGLRYAPMPKKPAPAPVAAATVAPKPPREAFTVDTLKAATQNMLSVNDALKTREASVAAREKKVRQQEEEIVAERGALDRLHAHFRELYSQFQQKLQLVSDSEQAQLARQVEIFNAMDPAQVADMMRSLDDGTIVRMFSIMESKPLSKLVAAWKTKYPGDSSRLLIAMNGMGRVVAENKIVLPASPSPVDGTAAPDANAAAPADASAPAATPDANASANPAPDATSQPATAPDASQSSATPAAPTDSSAPATDSNSSNIPNTPSLNTDSSANTPSSAPDATTPAASTDATAAPVPAPDASTPPAPATPATPDAPAAPAAAPNATTPAAPSQDSAPAPAPAPATPTTASTTTSDSAAPLDTPGETAEKAAAVANNAPGSAEAAEPSEFTPPTATLPVIHEKPVRIASSRNN